MADNEKKNPVSTGESTSNENLLLEVRRLWLEGLASGIDGELDMEAIKRQARRESVPQFPHVDAQDSMA